MILKRLSLTILLLLANTLLLGQSGSPAALLEQGFRPLFNGKDFTGWERKVRNGDDELAKKVFTVGEDGVVHVFRDFPDSFELDTGNSYTHGMMWAGGTYSRYIFRFEYKWGHKRLNNFGMFQYDAGCYYHVYNDKIWPFGIEYQVRYNHLTDENHTGDFWASSTSFQWYAGEDGRFRLPGEGGHLKSRKKGEHRCKPGVPFNALNDEWNVCEIIVMGDRYAIHKLNGEIVNLATGLSQKEGRIGLQSETAEIFYRNIMIKEFEEDVPIEAFLD